MVPAVHWSTILAVSRNSFVVRWPMVTPEMKNDVAIMLLTLKFLISLMLLCLIEPRRTLSMKGSDVPISTIQILLSGVGLMSVYSGALQSDFMFRLLSVPACIIFVSSNIIVLLKGVHWASKNESPGSSFGRFIGRPGTCSQAGK